MTTIKLSKKEVQAILVALAWATAPEDEEWDGPSNEDFEKLHGRIIRVRDGKKTGGAK